MDTYDIVHRTNGTFVQQFIMDLWADLYDFTAGHWHAHLRKQVESKVALYEWSTENGNITYEESFANGEITFTINPEIGDTLTLGATVLQFGVSGGLPIGTDLASTLSGVREYLSASDDVDVSRCDYMVLTGNILVIIYKTSGSLGNSFIIDTTVAGNFKSGDKLSGGGGLLTLTAPVDDLSRFVDDYYYDVRFQADTGVMTPIVGGIITFEEGVTRDTIEPISS